MPYTAKTLVTTLKALPSVKRYMVAFSGGLDSAVLLHSLANSSEALNTCVEAVHVHHGLQAESSAWLGHCKRICRRYTVPIRILSVNAHPSPGESPEAAARQARYEALRQLVGADACLLTAHHQDDQAETLLLQLLRGAGSAGLAAMPKITRFGAGWHARPLLGFTRTELEAYARDHRLSWVVDPSNRNLCYDRNVNRHRVFPALKQRWPSAAQTLTRAAAHQVAATSMMAELAGIDLRAAEGTRTDTLSAGAVRKLSSPRQFNMLRAWINARRLPLPTSRQLIRIREDVVYGRWDGVPCVHWPGAEIRRYRDDLYAMLPLPEHNPRQVLLWNPTETLRLTKLGIELNAAQLKSMGLSWAGDQQPVTIRFRTGGERCKPQGSGHHRSLKKLFQEAGVPPWERNRIPLIYVGDRLIAVVGLWKCASE